MLASHKFETDILEKEGCLEWLDLIMSQQLWGEEQTNKQKTKPANGMASEQQKDLCINTG